MRARKSISRLAQLVRTNVGSVSGIASAYRAISLTALAWLVALEAYRFANKTYTPNIDTHEATKGQATDRPGSPAPDAQENGPSIAGTQAEHHVKADGLAPGNGGPTTKSSDGTKIGSSTDPQIIANLLPSSPTPDAKVVTTAPPVSGIDLKSNPASIVLPATNLNDFVPVVQAGPAPPVSTAPMVSSVMTSGSGIDGSGNGDLNAGHVVTLTVNMSEVVTVAGGAPTLSLNNGGTASYTGGSGTNALTFSYTVGAGEDTSDLAVTVFNLNGATVSDAAGNSANLAGAVTNPSGVLQIDTTAPAVPSVMTSGSGIDGSGNGDLNAGHVVTLTVNMSEVVTVAGGAPTLSLNNGGTASYTGGSGTNALTFSYTVGAGEDTSDLAVTAFNLNGATVSDAAGNSANLAGAVTNPSGVLQIDTTAPAVPSVMTSGSGIDGSGNGDLNAGHVVTLTVNMSEVVTVAGGAPTLSLNNGGTASYTGGSGTNALTFSYTVGAGEDTSDLAVTAFNLNGATVSDAAGNSANLAGAVTNPSGVLQIDTTAPAVPSVMTSGIGMMAAAMVISMPGTWSRSPST